MIRFTTAILALLASPALADEDIPDQYPGSALYEKPVEVIPQVFSAIGATAPTPVRTSSWPKLCTPRSRPSRINPSSW